MGKVLSNSSKYSSWEQVLCHLDKPPTLLHRCVIMKLGIGITILGALGLTACPPGTLLSV